jgi:hypothetical protein
MISALRCIWLPSALDWRENFNGFCARHELFPSCHDEESRAYAKAADFIEFAELNRIKFNQTGFY